MVGVNIVCLKATNTTSTTSVKTLDGLLHQTINLESDTWTEMKSKWVDFCSFFLLFCSLEGPFVLFF